MSSEGFRHHAALRFGGCPLGKHAILVILASHFRTRVELVRLITLDCVLRKGTQSNWRGKQARICVLCDAFCPTHSATTSQRQHAPAPRQRYTCLKTNNHSGSGRPAHEHIEKQTQRGGTRRKEGHDMWLAVVMHTRGFVITVTVKSSSFINFYYLVFLIIPSHERKI